MFKGITTRDVLAIMTVGAALAFNGISLANGAQADAATMTLAGAVIGYYFKPGNGEEPINTQADDDEPLAAPLYGKRDE